ncbi:DUF2079 domain-containing protein, partial [bacterium]|nr:DUF2079 domain-containing protein [bacterium]
FGLVLGLLSPWLLLPLARPRWLLAATPVIAFACLRSDTLFKSITHWHHTNVFAWIFLALVESTRSGLAAQALGVRAKGRARARALSAGALGAAISAALLYGDAPFGRSHRPFSARPGQGAVVREIASSLPKDARIVATERAATHLVPEHPDVRILRPDLERGELTYLLDLADTWQLPSIPRVRRHLRDLRREGYGVTLERGTFVVLERGAPARAASDAAEAPPGPPRAAFPDAGLTLLAIVKEGEERARTFWRVDRRTEGDWGLIAIGPEGLAGDFTAIGPPSRPTYERSAGEVFSETRILALPAKGDLYLRVFDFLEVDASGKRLADVLAGALRDSGRVP